MAENDHRSENLLKRRPIGEIYTYFCSTCKMVQVLTLVLCPFGEDKTKFCLNFRKSAICPSRWTLWHWDCADETICCCWSIRWAGTFCWLSWFSNGWLWYIRTYNTVFSNKLMWLKNDNFVTQTILDYLKIQKFYAWIFILRSLSFQTFFFAKAIFGTSWEYHSKYQVQFGKIFKQYILITTWTTELRVM